MALQRAVGTGPVQSPHMQKLAIVSTGLLLTAFAAGCGGTRTVAKTITVEQNVSPTVSATGDHRVYGRIKSLQRSGSRYELLQLVAGKSSLKLFEPLSTGVWILVHVDTVRTFAQQYRP